MDYRDHYFLFLSCKDCLDIFPENKPSNFRIQLPTPLHLGSNWECALVDISFWPEFSTTKPTELFINTDIVNVSFALETLQPTIKRITVPASLNTKVNSVFPRLDFHSVNQTIIQTFQIYITDEKGLEPSFSREELYCTLLLRSLGSHC